MSAPYSEYSEKDIRLMLAPLAARLIPDALLTADTEQNAWYGTLVGMYETHLDELCKAFMRTHCPDQ